MTTKKDILMGYMVDPEEFPPSLFPDISGYKIQEIVSENDLTWFYTTDEVDHILDKLGLSEFKHDITGIQGRIINGDYADLLFTESSKPYMLYAWWNTIEYYLPEGD